MKFSFCKKCVEITPSKCDQVFLVVNPAPRAVLKNFTSFEEARDFARASSSSARVETHEGKLEICKNCGGEK